LSAKSKKEENDGPKVPAYIVTFSDMVTLLLTFFVMLLSLASDQDPELYNKSRDAFISSLNNIGLGMLQGHKQSPGFGKQLVKHTIRNPDEETDVRTIDADAERRRRIFRKVSNSMDTLKSQIVGESIQYNVARVHFDPSGFTLNLDSKKYLDQFSRNLAQDTQAAQRKLYILGMAADVRGLKQQWILSAKRAQVVAEYLGQVLPNTGQYPLFSWGAGAGGNWVDDSGFASAESHIFIGMLR